MSNTGALRHLQNDFQGYLLARDDRLQGQIVGNEQVGADERLAIYANAYRLRLLEALGTDYPGLHTIAGDDEFDALGRAYIDACPSRHFSLRWFGDRLSEFLRTAEPYSRYPVFSEMAAFEWAMSDAFDAPDTVPATIEDMAAIAPADWPVLTFTPHASLRRLNLRWNVPAIRKAHDTEQDPPELGENEYPVAWIVWRQGLTIYYRSLEVDEAWALDALCRSETFEALCEGLTEWIDAQHVAMHVAGLLKRWISDGLITRIQRP